MSVFTPDELGVIHEAHRIIELKFQRGEPFTSPQLVSDYLITKLAFEEQEVFRVMLLDHQHRLLKDVELTRGTIDGACVAPREVIKVALAHNAAAVILAHNHPSGVVRPSRADRQITTTIINALQLVQIRTLDHFIVGGVGIYSFAEHGEI